MKLLTLVVATHCLVSGTPSVVADNICGSIDATSSHELKTLPGGKGQILCDNDGGGWVVMQRRKKGNVLFDRPWQSYVDGFGSIEGDFWIGLQNIHKLCPTNCTFRVDLGYQGTDYFSEYRGFSVSGEADYYRLTLQAKVAGNTTEDDLLAQSQNGDVSVHLQRFSTLDADKDNFGGGNCASINGDSGWWWNGIGCGHTNPNGRWLSSTSNDAMYWKSVTGDFKHSVTFTELKLAIGPGVDWTSLDTRNISPAGVSSTPTATTAANTALVTTATTNTALTTTATNDGVTTTFISDAIMTALAASIFLFIFVNF